MSNEAIYQANFKTPKGSLINIRAWSEPELDTALDALLKRIQVISDVELAIDAIANINAGGLKVVESSGYPQPAQPLAVGSSPMCDHQEPMRLVPAGISKAGKPYKAFYACSRPRAEACNAKA